AGGRGANQALAAARSGAKVAIIGKTGDDDYAKRILDKIRREGVITTGVGKSEDNHTGLDIICNGPNGDKQIMKIPGANNEATADQIPEEILDDKGFLIIQTELPMAENLALLKKAKDTGATTMMNLAPSLEIKQSVLNHLDYLVLNSNEAKKFADKLGLPAQGNIEKIAQALAQIGELNCIITTGPEGAIAYTTDGTGWRIKAFEVDEIVDKSGAEDAYCGTLAACLHAGMPLPRALKRASIAGSLTCTAHGTQNAFPYLADIDERINDLDDPEKV
ncbi:MAG: PfkB family carbohydrate kinase, partial [Bdellovibrionales bacterium]